jgi:hypothetical protein
MQAMGILAEFQGVAVHDFWASYRGYDCDHALCNAHLAGADFCVGTIPPNMGQTVD